LRAVFHSLPPASQIVVGKSRRGAQSRMIVGIPNSDENSHVPRIADVPSFGFDTSFIGQNHRDI
jgi:hypothetical protein